MSADEGNIQVMHGCRNDSRKLSNNYSYGTFFSFFLSFSHRLIYYSKYFPVHSCPLPLIGGHHQENKQEEEGRASSPPGATEASQAREGATPRNPSHRRRRPEDDTGPITIDGVMPQKRFLPCEGSR